MAIDFLTNTYSKDLILDVIKHLKSDKSENYTVEQKQIVEKLIFNLEHDQKLVRQENQRAKFYLQENELNFISQNQNSVWTDYLIFRYKLRIFPIEKKHTTFPPHLLIEPVSYCNLRCIMCFQSDTSFTTDKKFMGRMELDLFKNIVDQASSNKCRAITLASRGEPTLHPNFKEMLYYLKDKFFDIKVNTNATKLNEKMCHWILDSGVTELVFSVDHYEKEVYENVRLRGKFDNVLKNIKRFVQIQKSHYPNSKCRTRVSGVKVDPKYDDNKFLKFWEPMVNSVGWVKMFERWDTYANDKKNKTNPCNLLWERLYIWYDGTANPCDCDYKSYLKVGNANEKTIKEIWEDQIYINLRKNHLSGNRSLHNPCDRCEY